MRSKAQYGHDSTPYMRAIGFNYLDRWYVIPRNKWFNIYLHRFRGSDFAGALHDHPWWNVTFKLKGGLVEVYEDSDGVEVSRNLRRFRPYLRDPRMMHRLLLTDGPAWTLFITGPRIREYGYRWKGWTHYEKFFQEYQERK